MSNIEPSIFTVILAIVAVCVIGYSVNYWADYSLADKACQECGYNKTTDHRQELVGKFKVECDGDKYVTVERAVPIQGDIDKWGNYKTRYEREIVCNNFRWRLE